MALLAAVGEAAAALAAAWIAHAAAKAVGEGNALKPRHGRTHRYAGMATLVWLGLGGVGADARHRSRRRGGAAEDLWLTSARAERLDP